MSSHKAMTKRITKEQVRTIIVCAFFQSGSVGLLINSSSLFVTHLAEIHKLPASSISLYFSLRTLISALCAHLLTKLFYKIGVRRHVLLMGSMLLISFLLLMITKTSMMLYIDAIICGFALSTLMIPMPVVINDIFKENKGKVLGLVLAISGVVSVTATLVIPKMIGGIGVEMTLLIAIGISMLLMLPAILSKSYLDGFGVNGDDVVVTEVGLQKSQPNEKLWKRIVLCSVALGMISALVSTANFLPKMALVLGYSFEVASLALSMTMIGNVIGKVLLGIWVDKFGIYKASFITIGIVVVALVSFINFPRNMFVFLGSSLIFGLIFGLSVVIPSILVLEVFGHAQYKNSIGTITGFTSLFVVAYSQLIGRYIGSSETIKIVFIIGLMACLISCLCLLTLVKKKSKKKEILEKAF